MKNVIQRTWMIIGMAFFAFSISTTVQAQDPETCNCTSFPEGVTLNCKQDLGTYNGYSKCIESNPFAPYNPPHNCHGLTIPYEECSACCQSNANSCGDLFLDEGGC